MSANSSTHAKVTITPFDSGPKGTQRKRLDVDKITVLFNPNNYSIEKTVTWTEPHTTDQKGPPAIKHLNAPPLGFGGGGSRVLTMELFYDITEPNNEKIKDVREETDKIVKLTRIGPDLERPQTVEVSWGSAKTADFPFVGVVSHLTQRFTLFRRTGEALRATLTVSFTEFLDPEIDLLETDPELTTRVVRRGDSLMSVAAQVYRDPTLWRAIAEANGLDDPLRPEIGRRLTIPKL